MAQVKASKIRDPSAAQLIRDTLIAECHDPAGLLELIYWSTDTKILPLIRALASLPSNTRAHLERFLSATDPCSVSAEIEADGRIRLTAKCTRM